MAHGNDGGPATTAGEAGSRRRVVYAVAAVLLGAPFVALLWVSSYANDDPRLFGFPFFYWYQLLWVFLAAAFTFVAYRLVRSVETRRSREREEQR